MSGDLSHVRRIGAAAVPFTASWSGEEEFFLGQCPHFNGLALCQATAVGVGRPLFGKPHGSRQREAIALGLCDLCGKSLRTSTKVSLSHARPQPHGADGWAVLQVEPLLHRRCALESCRWCPSLKRDIERGTLQVRQVHRYRAQCAIMSEEYVHSLVGEHRRAFGHAKVELIRWTDRGLAWLEAAA